MISVQSRGANQTGTRAAEGSSKRALFRNTTAGRKTTRACSGTRQPAPLFPLCEFRNTADHASRALASSIGQGTTFICVYASAPSAPAVSSSPPSLRPPPPPGGSGWRGSGPVCPCTTVQTHTPPHHPAAPRCAPPEEATYPTPPASTYPPRRGSRGDLRRLGPVGGGAVRATVGAWAIFLSGSSGWCWSTKQWGVEPRARHDLHLAWWGGRDGRGGVGMKGVASCTPTLQGCQGRYRWHGMVGRRRRQLGRQGGEVVGH